MSQTKLKTCKEALAWVLSFRPSGVFKFPGELGVERTRHLLSLLNAPQEKVKVVHIAGTSGKGSTATFISRILAAQGFKVSLTVSPHLLDWRERIQINNKPVTPEEFCALTVALQPAVEQCIQSRFGKPTYYELFMAMFFLASAKHKVKYAVVETGLGGLFDSSNVITSPQKLAIISRIGRDHQHVLGKSIKSIARQKAGIIRPGNTVLALSQHYSVNSVLRANAQKCKAKLNFCEIGQHLTLNQDKSINFQWGNNNWDNLSFPLQIAYQRENLCLALSAICLLATRDRWQIAPDKLREALQHLSFHGRFEIVKKTATEFILDGAHNPQKMQALIKALKELYPEERFSFLLAFRNRKQHLSMLKILIPVAEKIYLCSLFEQNGAVKNVGMPPSVLSAKLKTAGFSNYQVIPGDFPELQNFIKNYSGSRLVITGSLYLLSSIYRSVYEHL